MKNKTVGLLTMCLIMCVLVGCGAPKISEDQALLTMKYYSAGINHKIDINVDDQKIGNLKETGIFDNTWQFDFADGTFCEYVFSDYVELGDADSITATNYQIKDRDGNIIGYVQETVVSFENGSCYEYLFYDRDKELADYYFDDNSKAFYDWDGNLLVDCTREVSLKPTFFKGTAWNIFMVFDRDNCPVPLEHMMFGYMITEKDLMEL